MILSGHVAAAAAAAKCTHTDMRGAMAAAMWPDLIDKPTRWLLRLTPNDRIPAHSLLGWVCSTLLAWHLGGRRFARGFAVGYGAHLLGDELNAYLNPGRLYFWWPFQRYAMHIGPTGLSSSLDDFSRASLLAEGLVTVIGTVIWLSRRRQG
ncbi:MAG: metal-dependent hydrolase [Chloroflexi bacterium]|nr:metal-dependent hydrolase [Chloroflexota bacterium]